jgi:hypothetical protein
VFRDDQDSDLDDSAGTHVLLLCSLDFELLTASAMLFQDAGWCLSFAVTDNMVSGSTSVSATRVPEPQEFTDVDATALDTPDANMLALSLSKSTFRPKRMTHAEILVGIKQSWGITAPPSSIEFFLKDI